MNGGASGSSGWVAKKMKNVTNKAVNSLKTKNHDFGKPSDY